MSIIIPAFNEGRRIGATLREYLGRYSGRDCEFIVVLNGCTDDTLEVVKSFGSGPELRLIEFDRRLGKGGALLEGLKLAAGDYVGYVDADGSTRAADFDDLLAKIEGFDGAIASRYLPGAVFGRRQPFARLLASRGLNLLVRLLFGLNYADTQCGAKLFRRAALLPLLPLISATGWDFDIDLLFRAGQGGLRVRETPTNWSYAEGSTLNLARTVPAMLLSLARLRLRSLRGKAGRS